MRALTVALPSCCPAPQDLSRNQLVELPPGLAGLGQLRELVAQGNSFPRIPQVGGEGRTGQVERRLAVAEGRRRSCRRLLIL